MTKIKSKSTRGVFLPARMSSTERDAEATSLGLSTTFGVGFTIYNTTTALYETWDGASWKGQTPIVVNFSYNVPGANTLLYVAPRKMIVTAIYGRPLVAGTGGACTGVITKAATTVVVGSGVAINTVAYDFAAAINAVQGPLALSTSTANTLAATDALFLVVTGTATSATGAITIELLPTS